MPQESSKYVFISYNRRDDAVMKRIVSYLRERGINVWVDNERLVPGTPIWEEEIEKAIRGAFAVIVILSPASKSSEWVRREVTLVDNSHKRVFPVLITGGEEDAIPIRLITRQFVDLRKDEAEGLFALSRAISSYWEELDAQERSAASSPEKLIPPVSIPKPTNQNGMQEVRSANGVRMEAGKNDSAMAEMIRVARERERKQLAQSRQGGKAPAPSQKKKSNPLVWLMLAGGGLLCLFMVTVGPLVWKALTSPPATQPIPPTSAPADNTINLTPTNTVAPTPTTPPTDTSIPPTAIHTITPFPTTPPPPTFTFTLVPADTPPAPTDPMEFLIYYFDTIIFQKDFQKGWSLLTPAYQVGKTGGWDNYLQFWGTVKNWTRSSIQTEYNNFPRARVLITYRLYYYSGTSDPVDGVRYCLLWSEAIRTWQIDLRENCP